MTKRIVLCADDYGQAPLIDDGILTLVKMGRLSAVSCMVNTPLWRDAAKKLLPLRDKVDIGLHFNLTQDEPVSKEFTHYYGETFPSLPSLMLKASLRSLEQKIIEAELKAQLDKFTEMMGALPDFIDGHQHVHQFPVIRDALLNVYRAKFPHRSVYVRVINTRRHLSQPKTFVIYALGTEALTAALLAEHIPHNTTFSGIYAFDEPYDARFRDFLAESEEGGLIMCHPGQLDLQSDDPIRRARYAEYQYFISESFAADVAQYQVSIERFAKK